MGGSSKKQTVGYRYFLGQHQILVHGPCDNMTRYTVDDRVAWRGISSGGRINVYADSLFGGEGREGGVSGAMDLEMGWPDQGPNDYLQSKLGGTIPSFRGVVGIVQRQMYLGNNPYLKRNAFRLQRIYIRQDGVEQWNKPQAGVGSLWTGPQAIYIALDVSGSMDTITDNGQSRLTNAKAAISSLLDYIIELKSQSGQNVDIMGVAWGGTASTQQYMNATPSNIAALQAWFNSRTSVSSTDFRQGVASAPAFFAGAAGGANRIVLFMTDGEPDVGGSPTAQEIAEQAAATLFAITNVQSFAYNIDLANVTYTAQMDNTPQDGVPVVTGSNPDALFASLASSLGGTLDMNPAHIIRECLTDPIWGMGYAEEDIDETSFAAAAQTLWGEGMGMSIIWDRQMPMEQFVQEAIKHINASLYVGRRGPAAGKFVLKLIRGDYDEELLPHFDESNIEKVEGFRRVQEGELTNSVTVNYWDAVTGKTASTTAQDPALIQQQGAVINTTMQYPGFTNAAIANRVALRDLNTLSTPLASCTIYTGLDAKDLNIGDVIAVSWEDYGLVRLPMRITGMTLGDGKSNKIKMTLAQDAFALPEQGVIVPPDVGWEDPSQEPIPVSRQSAEELPYYELVQQLTQSAVDAQLATEPDTGFVGAAASRPQTGAINARFTTDSGAGYEDVGVIDFCPSALLDGPLGREEGDTEITLKNATDLSDDVIGDYAKIGPEYVYVTARAGLVLTVKRGVLDTIPHEHADETLILFSDPFLQADPTEYVASDIVTVKLLTVAGQGTLDPANAAPMETTLDSRAVRPYPVGQLKINDSYAPGTVVMEFDVTWASRNRILQTSPELVGYYDGSVTAEEGTTYTLKFYVNDDLKVEETGITDTFRNALTFSANGDARVEVKAVRGGYESWQAAWIEFPYTGGLLLEGTLPPGYIGFNYEGSLTATGGTPPYTWSLGAGAPAEWSIDPDTGEITGTATVADTYDFDVIVEDSLGEIATSPQSVLVSAGDPYWANVLSLLHFDGANGSTTFTDQKGKTWTRSGSIAQISTAQSKFGGASLSINTSGSNWLETPHVTGEYNMGVDFTLEAWIYRTVGGAQRDEIFVKSGSAVAYAMGLSTNAAGHLQGYVYNSGAVSNSVIAPAVLPSNQWIHVALVKNGSTLRLFQDGVQVATTALTGTFSGNTAQPAYIGNNPVDTTRTFDGYIDEFRYTQGVARYTANFTPPTAPFPNF